MIKINSKLNSVLAISKIDTSSPNTITTSYRTEKLSLFMLVESLAQSAGMHARYVTNFSSFGYLMGISNLTFPINIPLGEEAIVKVEAVLVVNTAQVYNYTINYSINGEELCSASLNIGVLETKDEYMESTNKMMKKRFKCLSS